MGYLGGENSENSDSTADNLTDTKSEKVQSEIYRNITSAQQLIDENKNSATVQITNGMFTLSFILSLIVCSVGFLLYWVMTLKQRELQFGIYRAMGMRMREVKAMLLNEQIFLSFLPLLAGSRHRYNCNSDVCKAHIDHISAAETQYRSKCIYLSI